MRYFTGLRSYVFLGLTLAASVRAVSYKVTDTFQGADFFNDFDFEAIADPTHGLVDYVDLSDAQSLGLATVTGNNFFLRADHTTVLTGGAGRKSVRIQSKKQWDNHVSVYNVLHMPQGLGTWPAIWENGDNWPNGGEVDILEGVNDVTPDATTLHTSAGCTMPSSRSMTGSATGTDCNAAANGNAGCGVHISDANSYGPAFNANGGGWYAMERTNNFVKVWFFARNDGSVPADIKNGASSINTDNWGTPDAYFPNTSCDIGSKFGPANIIINLTFCGDWAGAVFPGPGTCTDYVSKNPSAFSNAYFEIGSVHVYQ
ncbi:glycoside hydrolase family 16 protein [Peniophora sp. CONT]|nr:glycoside hydrolase family 16 protein [Peniophora sp. CONT]